MGRRFAKTSPRCASEPLEQRVLLAAGLLATLDGQPSQLTPVGEGLYYQIERSTGGGSSIVAPPPVERELRYRDKSGRVHVVRPIDGQAWRLADGASITGVAGRAVVIARDADRTQRFWSIDPMTHRAAPLVKVDSPPPPLVHHRGLVYFMGYDETNGWELFRSDGTPAGTRMALTPSPGTESGISWLTSNGSQLYFVSRQFSEGPAIVRSDGTASGTRVIFQVPPPSNIYENPPRITNLMPAGNRIYFQRSTSLLSNLHYIENDRGPSFQVPEVSISGGVLGTRLAKFTAVGSRLFFTLSGNWNVQIAVTDGTAAGARTLAEFKGVTDSDHSLHVFGDSLLITVAGVSSSSGTWRIGPDNQVTRLTEQYSASFDGTGFAVFQSKAYLAPGHLYVTDGTASGTRLMHFNVQHVVASNDRIYYTSGSQLWGHDPTRGAVEGVIYNDANRNGVHDMNENEWLRGFRVFVDLNHDGEFNSNEPWARSDGSGRYNIDLLPPGQYTVRLTQVSGWLPTSPAVASVTVRRDRVTRLHFGQALNRGSIEGFVYNDSNRNGVRDRFESEFLSGFRVFVDLNNDGRLNGREPWARTDATGRYRFDDLASGQYVVRLTQVSGWEPTSRAAQTLDVRRNRTAPAHFGNAGRSSASGRVFQDLNGNGVPNAGEAWLAGFRVFVDVNRNGRWDLGEPFTRSDEDGHYRLDDIHSGSVALRIATGDGWVITSGASSFRVPPGDNLTHSFGLRPA